VIKTIEYLRDLDKKADREEWHPQVGTVGIIMKETIGSHGKIYVLFESDGKTSVLKLALENIGEDSRAWSTSKII
jgi:hypothetical protein